MQATTADKWFTPKLSRVKMTEIFSLAGGKYNALLHLSQFFTFTHETFYALLLIQHSGVINYYDSFIICVDGDFRFIHNMVDENSSWHKFAESLIGVKIIINLFTLRGHG